MWWMRFYQIFYIKANVVYQMARDKLFQLLNHHQHMCPMHHASDPSCIHGEAAKQKVRLGFRTYGLVQAYTHLMEHEDCPFCQATLFDYSRFLAQVIDGHVQDASR